MLRAILPAMVIGLAALPALAEDGGDWRFGGDAYVGGRTVVVTGAAVDDLFAAGQSVTATAEIRGSAHMAGQNVTLEGRVGENFYGAGQDVDIDAPVAGNVTMFGQNLTVTEPVSGNLRAGGQSIELRAPVAGSAVIGGESVRIDAVVSGDLALASEDVAWGNDARVEGELHLYTDSPDAVEVPDTVVAGDRLDNLAAHYIGDPEQFWRICDANNALRPHELTQRVGRRLRITLPEGIPGASV